MCPDIEWKVEDDSDQHSVMKTPPNNQSRRRKITLGLVILLGIGLGVIYSSISAPPLKPTPTSIAFQPAVTQRQTLAPKATRRHHFSRHPLANQYFGRHLLPSRHVYISQPFGRR
jgi:hypothetical protein